MHPKHYYVTGKLFCKFLKQNDFPSHDIVRLCTTEDLKVLQEGVKPTERSAHTFHTRLMLFLPACEASFVCVFCTKTMCVCVQAGQADGAASGHKQQSVRLIWWTVRKRSASLWADDRLSADGVCVFVCLTRFSWLRAFTRFSSPLMYFTSSTPFLYSSGKRENEGWLKEGGKNNKLHLSEETGTKFLSEIV